MNKKEILNIVTGLESQIGEKKIKDLFDSSDNADGKERVGCGQFRNIARECSGAECIDEIRLMFDYTIAKAKDDTSSWNKKCSCGKAFGQLIKEKMKRIISDSATDEEKRKNLELFFGYMYWQSRIWASKAPKSLEDGETFQDDGEKNEIVQTLRKD
ncbi:MAG: hypothetical protein LUE12_01860 [Ruminococcus sp.]|nr:hypothetical protein [Ruminococcus sp.]